MTVKTETNFYKTFKKCLESGTEKYIITRIESYVTPGFPDCLIYHKDIGFFTVELKVVRRNKKGIGNVSVSPLQIAWNTLHASRNALVFTLVYDPGKRHTKLFSSAKLLELRDNDYDSVDGGLWTGVLGPGYSSELLKLLKLRKLP
jgi:hypothetical protein